MSNAWKEAGLSDAKLPRQEVELVKTEILQTPGGLRDATKRLQTSYYRQLASLHPRTRTLYRVWTFIGLFNLACLTVFPIAVFILTRWYWAFIPIVLNFLLVQPIHNKINLELFARLLLIQHKMADPAQADVHGSSSS